ncbi:MAG: MerR family transcriptional regulator, partial [Gammaproteobacteria bacterium]|nr:MerR family transcriptional regulator [Gemmatimonadota bacterium]MBT5154080.1 MerR family transcriptional regulator [Gammaproteobacteria bacterium]
MTQEYTIESLAKLVGLQRRTIRNYITQGLLRGPDSLGRNARYTDYHLKRLKLIKQMKLVLNLSLSEIRRLLNTVGANEDLTFGDIKLAAGSMPDDETETESSEMSEAMAPMSAPLPASSLEAEPEQDELSALDFIRQRKALTEGTPALRQRGRHRSGRPAPVAGPIEDLLQQLRDLLAHAAVTRKTRGEEWVRLQITPDIEIHVRGHLSSEQLAGFEELSDMMRHILLGRSEL